LLTQTQRQFEHLNKIKEALEGHERKGEEVAHKEMTISHPSNPEELSVMLPPSPPPSLSPPLPSSSSSSSSSFSSSKDEGSIEERIRHILSKDKKISKEDTKESLEQKIQSVMRKEALVYIHYMRFGRRTEGSKAMRHIFSRARKSPSCTNHVFLASALLEFVCHKEANIGLNIIRVGAQKFGEDPDYILHYIDYLIHLNDDSNIRALFEKGLSSLPPEKSKKLWNAFLDFETKYGDLATIKKLEKRRAETYPDKIFGFASLAERYKFMDLLPCEPRDLQIFSTKKHPKLVLPASCDSSTLNLLIGVKKKDVIKPDLSQMVVYNKKGGASSTATGTLPSSLLPFKAILTQSMYGTLFKFLQSLLTHPQPFQGILIY
jgi:hypothetical protein